MSKFIKYREYIINVDNIDYIDLEADSQGNIRIRFGTDNSLIFAKNSELVTLLNSLLEDQLIKNTEK